MHYGQCENGELMEKIRQKVNYMSSEKSLGVDAVGIDYVQQHQQNLYNHYEQSSK